MSRHRHRWSIAIVLVWLLPCAALASASPLQERLRGFHVGAHRGGFWSVAQSTSADFAASIDGGADIIEMDLRSTKDGGVVVYHSDTLSRHTFCFGFVRDTTFADIAGCGLLPMGTRIEGFQDVLRWTRGKNVIVNAEFKDDDVIVPALALVDAYDAWDRIYFQANAHYERYAHARELSSRANMLVNAGDMTRLRWALDLDDPHLVVIGLRGKQIQTPEAVALIHDYGKVASANSWPEARFQELFTAACNRLFAIGIDIAVTNNVRSCVTQRDAMLAGANSAS